MLLRTFTLLLCLVVLGFARSVVEAQEREPRESSRASRPSSLQLEFVELPGGSFMMGCPTNPPAPWKPESNAVPLHRVTLKAFAIGKYPVTRQQFCIFLNETKQPLKPELDELLLAALQERNHQYMPEIGKENFPVEGVRFDLAKKFCAWASEVLGCVIRLPTEAEWEYAAKGAAGRTYPWGERLLSKNTLWSAGRMKEMATPDGIYDLNGPVLQWCEDYFDEQYYQYSPELNPVCKKESVYRVVRGGYKMRWGKSEERVYPATWTRFALKHPDKYTLPVGFRVVKELSHDQLDARPGNDGSK
jgi:formylglycine-generating enzyme